MDDETVGGAAVGDPAVVDRTVSDTSAAFLRAIELTETEALVSDRAFLAMPQPVPWAKAYGGDTVAQAAVSAVRTVAEDRVIHSMHGYFMRPSDPADPVRYEIEQLRDGRSFSTRGIRAYQYGKPIFVGTVSFHISEEGAQQWMPQPSGLPDPESLPSSAQVLVGVDSAAAKYWSHGRSFDMRHVPSPVYLRVDGELVAHQAVWIKAFDALPDDANVHRAALAYVCDYTILEPVLRAHGYAWADQGLVTASLDHALWFHRAGRMDRWVVYVQEAVSAQGGRGLAQGRFYDADGTLLASVAQEGMIRKSHA